MAPEKPDERPVLQKIMDNPWLLLVVGVVVPTVSYTLWAWLELLTLPQATLP